MQDARTVSSHSISIPPVLTAQIVVGSIRRQRQSLIRSAARFAADQPFDPSFFCARHPSRSSNFRPHSLLLLAAGFFNHAASDCIGADHERGHPQPGAENDSGSAASFDPFEYASCRLLVRRASRTGRAARTVCCDETAAAIVLLGKGTTQPHIPNRVGIQLTDTGNRLPYAAVLYSKKVAPMVIVTARRDASWRVMLAKLRISRLCWQTTWACPAAVSFSTITAATYAPALKR